MTGGLSKTRFVVMAGLPGTGKTALAEALANRLGGVVLSKDRVRAALFPPGAIEYSAAQDDFCMTVILQAAQQIVTSRQVSFIFLDGRTFSRASQIEPVVHAAAAAGVDYSILYLRCPDSLALERIAVGRESHLAANRDADLYFRVKASFEPITLPKLEVDTSAPMEHCVELCASYLENGSDARSRARISH